MSSKHWILLLALFCIGCYTNFDNSETEISQEDPEIFVDSNMTGHTSNPDGSLLSDYQIHVNNEIYNVKGKYFNLRLIDAKKLGQLVKVYKDGNLVAYKEVFLVENDFNHVRLNHFSNLRQEEIVTSGNVDLSIDTEIQLNFNTNDLKDMAGNSSAENILTKIYLEDNLKENQRATRGFSEAGIKVRMDIEKSFCFEFKNILGEKLQLSGNQSRLAVNVENGINDQSLFWYDESKERWLEIERLHEGLNDVQIINDGFYIQASKTSAVFVEGDCRKDNSFIAYQDLSWEFNGTTVTTRATSSGKWLDLLPSKSTITYSAINPCDELMQNFTISTSESNIQNQTLNLNNGEYQSIQTVVYSCDNQLVNEPSIELQYSNNNLNILTFGETDVNALVPICSDGVEIGAYNIEEDEQGPALSWDESNLDEIGYLSDCQDLIEGFSIIQIKDDKKVYPMSFTAVYNGTRTTLQSADGKIRFHFDGNATGDYTQEDVHIYMNDTDFGDAGYAVNCELSSLGCGISSCHVSHYDETTDGWIRVSFEGEVWMQTISPASVGTFPVKGVIVCQVN